MPGGTLNTSTATTSGVRYYSLPGGTVADRTGTTTYGYEITDLHGTPYLQLDYTAQTPTWRQFTPYGDTRGTSVSWPDNRTFLDKTTDTSTGLIDVGAREYDPPTGAFITLDPVLEPTDPQALNGYSYADDNPVTGSDPTGLRPCYDNPCTSLGTGSGSGSSSGGSHHRAKRKPYKSPYTYGAPEAVSDSRDAGIMRNEYASHAAAGGGYRDTSSSASNQGGSIVNATKKVCHGFFGCAGHDLHGVLEVSGSLAPYVTAAALATAWIPGVDVVTASSALTVDSLATANSAWNVDTELTNSGWGAFGHQNIYLDAGGVLLGGLGLGTSIRSATMAGESAAERENLNSLKATAKRSRSGTPAVKAAALRAKEQLPAARKNVFGAGAAAAYADTADQLTNGAGAAESQVANIQEESWNAWAVTRDYSWAW